MLIEFATALLISIITGVIIYLGQKAIKKYFYPDKFDNMDRDFPFEYIEDISFITPLESLTNTLGHHDSESESYVTINNKDIRVRDLDWDFKDLEFKGIVSDNKNTLSAFEIWAEDSIIKFNRNDSKPFLEITVAYLKEFKSKKKNFSLKLNKREEFCSLEITYLESLGDLVLFVSNEIEYNKNITNTNFPDSITVHKITKMSKNFLRQYEN